MKSKINQGFVISQYVSGVGNYERATKEVGLWASEKHVFEKHLKKTDRILDLGCGTGRTTFHLSRLGYENIIGIDLTPAMITAARGLNEHFKTDLSFEVGDACNLSFAKGEFDAVIFSFNGIMSIPKNENRETAFGEISRVLKPGGSFVFTTHDRDAAPEYLSFWEDQKKRWEAGERNPRLYDYGDIIADSNNEESPIYIHIPSRQEVEQALSNANFSVVETFYRSEQFTESTEIKDFASECRFWVAQKTM